MNKVIQHRTSEYVITVKAQDNNHFKVKVLSCNFQRQLSKSNVFIDHPESLKEVAVVVNGLFQGVSRWWKNIPTETESVETCLKHIDQGISKIRSAVFLRTPKHDRFLCAISRDIVRDPVRANCGHLFEKLELEKWLQIADNRTCPTCRQPVGIPVPCLELKEVIEEWEKEAEVPNFSHFDELDSGLAQAHLERAGKMAEKKDYAKAVASFKIAFQHTNNWRDYVPLVEMYFAMDWEEDEVAKTCAILSSLYLASYQLLEDSGNELALPTLLTLIGKVKLDQESSELVMLVMQLLAFENRYDDVYALLNKNLGLFSDEQKKSIKELLWLGITKSPENWALYEALSCLSSKDKVKAQLAGASQAVVGKKWAQAYSFLQAALPERFIKGRNLDTCVAEGRKIEFSFVNEMLIASAAFGVADVWKSYIEFLSTCEWKVSRFEQQSVGKFYGKIYRAIGTSAHGNKELKTKIIKTTISSLTEKDPAIIKLCEEMLATAKEGGVTLDQQGYIAFERATALANTERELQLREKMREIRSSDDFALKNLRALRELSLQVKNYEKALLLSKEIQEVSPSVEDVVGYAKALALFPGGENSEEMKRVLLNAMFLAVVEERNDLIDIMIDIICRSDQQLKLFSMEEKVQILTQRRLLDLNDENQFLRSRVNRFHSGGAIGRGQRGDQQFFRGDRHRPEVFKVISLFGAANWEESFEKVDFTNYSLRNLKTAASRLNEWASSSGTPHAACVMGLLHYIGLGCEQNFSIAKEYFESEVGIKHPFSLYMLGKMYEMSYGVVSNQLEAIDYYKKSYQEGFQNAAIRMFLLVYFGNEEGDLCGKFLLESLSHLTTKKGGTKVEDALHKLGSKNDPEALLILGEMRRRAQSYRYAKQYLEKAVKLGNNKARERLSLLQQELETAIPSIAEASNSRARNTPPDQIRINRTPGFNINAPTSGPRFSFGANTGSSVDNVSTGIGTNVGFGGGNSTTVATPPPSWVRNAWPFSGPNTRSR